MKTNIDRSASLVETLQALAAEMAKASTEAEADAGLKKLRQIRTDFLGKENDHGTVNAARRDAASLIAWLETRLEQLRQQLARKRRIQEGEVMEQLAKQREAEGPSLLPTELVDAVVHSTKARDPEKVSSTAPKAEAAKPEAAQEARETPEKEPEKDSDPDEKTPEPMEKTPEPMEKTPEPMEKTPEPMEKTPEPEEKSSEPKEKTSEPEEKNPGERKQPTAEPQPPAVQRPKPAPEKPEFSKYEQLVAHLAASVGENSYFFEKLRKLAKRPGAAQKPPADDRAAETHYRTVHDLSKRLVNLELQAKAIAKARERKEPVSPLVKTAARELKNFMRDFKTAKEKNPGMAGEYDRRFGGYAEQFSAMKPETGQAVLDLCRSERQVRKPDPEKEPERELEVPQLVLKRDDNFQH